MHYVPAMATGDIFYSTYITGTQGTFKRPVIHFQCGKDMHQPMKSGVIRVIPGAMFWGVQEPTLKEEE